jgi:hypothetical protein
VTDYVYGVLSGTGVDWQVSRVESNYDVMGRVMLVSSYEFFRNLVNQVARAFNGFGQMTSEQQAHTGPVDAATTPQVRERPPPPWGPRSG